MSSSIVRVIRNFLRIGPREYLYQLNRIGDTKSGKLVGTDLYGNKFFENSHEDEIYGRQKWVEYPTRNPDMDKVEPGWHFWLGHGINPTPTSIPEQARSIRPYPIVKKYQNFTGTTKAYVPYSTVRPKVEKWTWKPTVAARG